MTSPFDYAKSVTHTKESLYTTEEVFVKEYLPFMVNRALSNSPQTALFADAMNQYPNLDKKLQYDFYLTGIPKQTGFTKWVKKEDQDLNVEHLQHICEVFECSLEKAIEKYKVLGPAATQANIEKRGGRQ